MRALGFFCPCCSTWQRWVIDTFALSNMSGLGSPDVFEGGGAGFGCFDKWRVVVSWRGCVEDRGNLWIVNRLGCPVLCGAMPCRRALCCVVWLYALSFSSTPHHLALWLLLAYGCCLACCVVIWLLGCRLARVWRFSLLFGALLWALGWEVISGVEKRGEKNAPLNFLGPPSGFSFPSINRPTSLRRGEGHLMYLSSMRASSGGDGDNGDGMRKEWNWESRSTIDLISKLCSHAQQLCSILTSVARFLKK